MSDPEIDRLRKGIAPVITWAYQHFQEVLDRTDPEVNSIEDAPPLLAELRDLRDLAYLTQRQLGRVEDEMANHHKEAS